MRCRDVDGAMNAAREVECLSLDRALRLCILLAERWDHRYPRAALRMLVRVLDELPDLPVLEIKKFADALAHANHGAHQLPAREALHNNVQELKSQRLRCDFDSIAAR